MQSFKNNIKRQYGLIGYPLEHSFSRTFFTEEFIRKGINDAEYTNFPINSITQLPDIIQKNRNLLGLSVTSPYKESVLDYLDETDEAAKAVGAVNLIKIIRGKKTVLIGYNTDIYGFNQSLMPFLSENNMTALILGTGGAAKAVRYALKLNGISSIFVSRENKIKSKKIILYEELTQEMLIKNRIVINATPLGMHPETDKIPPINTSFFNKNNIVFDLIYNPKKTIFLEQAEKNGAKIINGEKMLYEQAKKAWEILEI